MRDNLQGHLKGTQFLVLLLKMSKLSDCFMFSGTNSHIFRPINDTDSVPCYTEYTCLT